MMSFFPVVRTSTLHADSYPSVRRNSLSHPATPAATFCDKTPFAKAKASAIRCGCHARYLFSYSGAFFFVTFSEFPELVYVRRMTFIPRSQLCTTL